MTWTILYKLLFPLPKEAPHNDEPRYEKTHIFAYVRTGQPAGSKEINNASIREERTDISAIDYPKFYCYC